MARGRRRDEWDRTAGLMSWVALKWTGQKIPPDKLNPIRLAEAERAEATPEQRKARAKEQVAIVGRMMLAGRKKQPKPKG